MIARFEEFCDHAVENLHAPSKALQSTRIPSELAKFDAAFRNSRPSGAKFNGRIRMKSRRVTGGKNGQVLALAVPLESSERR